MEPTLTKKITKLKKIIHNKVEESTSRMTQESISLQAIIQNIEIENKEYLDNLHYAQIIQEASLPKQRHLDRIFEDSFYVYKPKHIIGGDFFWCSEKDNFVFFALGDCTGHGVPGAMLATLGISLLNYAILNKGLTKSNEILNEIDKRFIESFKNEHDELNNNDWMELIVCVYDKNTKTVDFASARRSLFVVRGNQVLEFGGDRFPVGGWQIEKNRTFTSKRIPLRNEDFLYLTSDGFSDQFGEENFNRFSKARLKQLMLDNYANSGKNQKSNFEQTFINWQGNIQQTDDVCLLGLKLSNQEK
jgi:serine phosphatase RsbU (regulator of sigma subunit)